MRKSCLNLIAGLVLAAGMGFGQDAPAAPSFEVASIKPSAPLDPAALMAGKLHLGQSLDGARLDWGFASLTELVCAAYKVKPTQIKGPDWLIQQRFDVVAKLPEGSTKDQVPDMLKSLLSERFKLSAHQDHKEGDTFALTVGKSGVKMKESEPDPVPAQAGDAPAAPADKSKTELTIGSADGPMKITAGKSGGAVITNPKFGTVKTSMSNGMIRMEYARMKMSDLADALTALVGRPVTNETGLTANYQVVLEYAMSDLMNLARSLGVNVPAPPAAHGSDSPAEAASEPSGNSILASVQALGLKLESRKGAVDTLVIDHIEKSPTEN